MQNDLRNGIIVVMPIPKATRFVKDVTVMDMPVNKRTQIYIALRQKKMIFRSIIAIIIDTYLHVEQLWQYAKESLKLCRSQFGSEGYAL